MDFSARLKINITTHFKSDYIGNGVADAQSQGSIYASGRNIVINGK